MIMRSPKPIINDGARPYAEKLSKPMAESVPVATRVDLSSLLLIILMVREVVTARQLGGLFTIG